MGRFPGKDFIIAVLLPLLLLAGQGHAALPSAALRQTLSVWVRPEFEHFAWSPMFFSGIGLVYDTRAEPCLLEIAALEKKVATAPADAAGRHRLGWLLNRYGAAGSGNRWIEEAARICRQSLQQSPNDVATLARLALIVAGTEEADQAVRKAIALEPNSWRGWDALARHQLRTLEQRVLGNLPTTPQEMAVADFPRLEKALRAHAADPDLTAAMFRLEGDRETHARRAMEAAPETLEPLLNYLTARIATGVIMTTLRRVLDQPPSNREAFDTETLALLDRAVTLAGEDPALLGALGFIQAQTRVAMFERAARARSAAAPPAANAKPPPRYKFTDKILPVLPRLREISATADPARAAAAAEAYGALRALIPMIGGDIPADPELPAMLAAAVEKAPRRPLLWDILLGLRFTGVVTGPFAPGEDPRSLAERRLKHLPGGRSHAMIAYASTGEPARLAWIEAVKLDPTNIEYLLNLTAATLGASQTPESVDLAIAILQRASELSYSEISSWQKPRLEAFRLRTYAVCLILRGEDERAHTLLMERIRDFPDDIPSRAIRDALLSE